MLLVKTVSMDSHNCERKLLLPCKHYVCEKHIQETGASFQLYLCAVCNGMYNSGQVYSYYFEDRDIQESEDSVVARLTKVNKALFEKCKELNHKCSELDKKETLLANGIQVMYTKAYAFQEYHNATVDQMSVENAKLFNQNEEFKKEIKQLKEKNGRLTEENERLNNKIKNQASEIQKLHASSKKQQRDVTQKIEDMIIKHNEALQAAKNELKSKLKDIERYQTKLAVLDSSLQNCNKIKEGLESRICNLNKEMINVKSEHSDEINRLHIQYTNQISEEQGANIILAQYNVSLQRALYNHMPQGYMMPNGLVVYNTR